MARSRYLKWDNGTDSPANDLPPDTWRVGDYRENDDQTSPIVRWRCTVAGTPGTWVPLYGGFGILSPAPNSVMVALVDYDAVVANGVTVYGSGTFGTANDATGKFGYAASTGVLATDIQTAWDAAVLTPFKTLEAVGKAYPHNGGNGANLRIIVRPRASFATYRNIANTADESAAWLNDVSGWRSVLVRGSLGLLNTTADSVTGGFIAATGTNAGGYNAIAGTTATSYTCQLAGGGAPGFTAESAGWSAQLGLRIRFDSATTTTALQNTITRIHEIQSTNILIPMTNASGSTVPATSDVFYVESPGVVLGNLTHTAGINGSFSMTGFQATAASTITNPGVATYSGLTFTGANTTTISGAGTGTLTLTAIKKDAIASCFVTSAFRVVVTSSAIQAIPAITASVTSLAFGAGCVSRDGFSHLFTTGPVNTLVGNQSSTTSRKFRITGATSAAAISVGGLGATVRGVDFSNCTHANGLVYFSGASGAKASYGTWLFDDLVSGHGGNTTYVLNLTDAGNSRAPFANNVIYWGISAANTVTTSLSAGIGDFHIAYGCVVRSDALNYCNLPVHGFNIFGPAASSTNMSGRPIVGDTIIMENLDTDDILPRRLVKAADADPVQFPLHGQMHVASADTAANATGVLGVLITNNGDGTATAAGALGVVALSGLIPIQFDSAPTTGAQAYLSTLTGASRGMATVTKPANLAVYVGTVEEWSSTGGVHIGWVNFRPSPALQVDPHQKGADIASASTILLPDTLKNYFHVTGATTIDFIGITNVDDGKEIDLYFVSTPQLNHNTGGIPAQTAPILLTGALARRMVARATVSLRYDAALPGWKELDNGGYVSTAHVLLDRNDLAIFPNGVNLGALTTGLLKQTVSTSIATISIAAPGTDYAVSVAAGTGISVGNVAGVYTVTNTGTLTTTGTALQIAVTAGQNPTFSLINTAVTPGSYTYGGFTVDSQGRLTAASSGTAPVTSLVAGTGISVSGTTVVTVSNTGVISVTAGTNVTNSGTAANPTLNVVTGAGLTAGTGITFVSGTAVTSNLSTGVAGGQSGFGGSAASENLVLSSTSHATKGKISFGSLSVGVVVDEANTRLGVGTGSPGAQLHLDGGTTGDQARIGHGANYFKIGRSTSTGLLEFNGTQAAAYGYLFTGAGGDRMSIGTTGVVAINNLSAGGLVKATVTTGALVIASAGTDYIASITGTAPINVTAGGTPVVSLNDTVVTPGTYTFTTLTVDQKGRLTAASSGSTAGFQPVISLTSGSVVFSGGGSTLSQNNAAFFWDNSTARLGIGTNAPACQLELLGGTSQDQLRIGHTGGNYYRIGRDTSTGPLYFYGSQTAAYGFVFTGGGGDRMSISTTGTVTINDLAGSGNRLVLATSAGLLTPVVLGTNLSFTGTTLNATAGGATSPAGSNTQLQFNNSGVFGASSLLTFTTSLFFSNTTQSWMKGKFATGPYDVTGPSTADNFYMSMYGPADGTSSAQVGYITMGGGATVADASTFVPLNITHQGNAFARASSPSGVHFWGTYFGQTTLTSSASGSGTAFLLNDSATVYIAGPPVLSGANWGTSLSAVSLMVATGTVKIVEILDVGGGTLRVETTGSKIGFMGATPVARAATPTTLANVITILQNVGLCT